MMYGQRERIEMQNSMRPGLSAQQRENQRRLQRVKEIDERKKLQDLYRREMQKMRGYYSAGGKRRNVSPVYLRNLDRLKHMSQGTRRPLDMIDVFGRQ